MNKETMQESLSALFDGEAGELELRQVLRACEDSEMRDRWSRMHLVRATMHGEPVTMAPSDLGERIFAALDQEDTPAEGRHGSFLRPLQGLAVAATVAFVAVLGVQGFDAMTGAGLSPQGNSSVQQQASLGGSVYQPGQFRGISNQAAYANGGVSGDATAGTPGELSPGLLAAKQRLQDYMFRHAEFSSLNSSRGMMPFARVASFTDQ